MFLKKKQKIILVLVLAIVTSLSFSLENKVFATDYIHNYSTSSTTGWSGSFIWAEPFTGLVSNETIHNLKLNVTSIGGTSHVRAKIFTDNATLTTLTDLHFYHATNDNNLVGNIHLQKFIGLPPGRNITSVNFDDASGVGGSYRNKVYDDTGISEHISTPTQTRLIGSTFTGMNGAVHVAKFTGLTPNRPILSMGIGIITTGGGAGDLRYKVYDDNGTGPNNLLGETGSNFEASSGFYTFNFPVGTLTPASGTIWAGFETDNTNMQIDPSSSSGPFVQIAHTYGSGPNPFGHPTSGSNSFWVVVTYSDYDIHNAPGNLLGEGFNGAAVNTGFNNGINFNATIPSDGVVYAGFELGNNLNVISGNSTTGEYQMPHTLGAGPSFAFANQTNSTLAHAIELTYIDTIGPHTLLGETGSTLINSTGINSFSFSGVKVPSNGKLWAGFETDQVNLGLRFATNLNLSSASTGSHTFGSGPTTFSTPRGAQTFAPYMSLNVDSPSITVTPAIGIVGNTATLSGIGMGISNNLSFTFAGSPLTTSPATVTTNSTGGFSGVTFIVPATSNGVKTINATNNAGISATASYSVNPSSFSISPTSGNVGTVDSFSGTGFSELDTVTIKFDSSTVDTITSDSIGNISGLFTIPSSTKGSHTITATDTHGNNKTATFTTNTSISISPTSGSSGKTITINGDGFNSSSTMHIYFNNVLQTTSPGTVTTNSTGSFSGVTFTVPTLPVNTYIVKAIDAGTNQATQNFILHQTVPDAPTLAALALSPTSIRFTSVAGASSGDNPVIWYGLICQTNGGSWTTIVSNSSLPSSRIYERTGLQPGDVVGCEWRDGSKSGWSLWSNEASTSTTLPLVQPPMTNNHLTTFIKWIADHGGIYFGFTIGPFIPMLLGLMATPKTVGIFAVITLMAMGIVHASGLYVYPSWYWGLMLLFGVVLVLSRANEK